MLNKAILVGRLTADPELKTTPSGVSVCSFSIAIDRPYRNGTDKVTDFIDIVTWRQTAEFIAKHFGKGNAIAIDGSIQVRSYTDREGSKRRAFEVVGNNVSFVERKGGESAATGGDAAADNGDYQVVDSDESLPF